MDRSLNPVVRPGLATSPGLVSTRRRRLFVHLVLLLSDQCLILASFALAYWMRYHADWPPALEPIVSEVAVENYVGFDKFVPIALLLVAVLTMLFETKGLYQLHRGASIFDQASIIVSSTLTGIALLIVVVFLYRPFYYSRLIFAFAGVNSVIALTLWRLIFNGVRHWRWVRGVGQQRVLVVGATGLGQQVMNGIAAQPGLGYNLVGYLGDRVVAEAARASRIYRHLGAIDDLEHTIQRLNVDQVILALPFWEHDHLPQMVQTCRTLGVEYHIAPDLYQLSFDRVDVLEISGVPLIKPKEVSLRGWNLALKRMLDVGLIVVTAPVTLPLALMLAALIRLDSPGPALFRQTRIGKGGAPFTCLKFRTMVADAEAWQTALSAFNEADGPLFKMRDDPRITRIGRFLRRSSLDELPQLLNVLRGEMSIVGPRPALPLEVASYEPWHRRRLEVMPGLTGLGQALGRSDLSFDETVRLDIYYAENWSVGMDLRIMLMTIPVVLSGRGAY